MRRTRAGLVGGMAVAVALSGACGGGSDEPSASQTDVTAPASTVPAGQSAEVVTNDGARLRITLAVGGAPVDGQADVCANGAVPGRAQVPVTLTVLNLDDRAIPFPPVRLETTATDGTRERTLVRDPAGECSPFPRIAQLGPRQSAVFHGSSPAGGGRIEVRISEMDFVLAAPRA